MQKLQTNMLNANSAQNMTQTPSEKNVSTYYTSRLDIRSMDKTRTCNPRRNNRDRTIYPRWKKRNKHNTNGSPKSLWRHQEKQLRKTLYKKGIRLEPITHIRNGRRKHSSGPNANEPMDKKKNNVGVSQDSAVSALMFIIRLEDTMEDYEAMNRKARLIARQQIIRGPNADTSQLLQHIQNHKKTPREKSETNQK